MAKLDYATPVRIFFPALITGLALSAYGPAPTATAVDELPAGPQCATGGSATDRTTDLTVGSYNITGQVASEKISGWQWAQRKVGIVDLLARCTADVYALQEDSVSWIRPFSNLAEEGGKYPDTMSQYEQLRDELNAELKRRGRADRYEYANAGRDSCKSRSSGYGGYRGQFDEDCVYSPASAHPFDNRILYNTASVEPYRANGSTVWQGVQELPKKTQTSTRRTLHWAKFRPLAGGKYAIVATTHLEAGSDSTSYRARMSQIEKIRAKLISLRAATSDPIVLTGDLNANRARLEKIPSDVLRYDKTLKMIDVTGQDYAYYTTRSGKRYRGKCAVPAAARKSAYFVPYTSAARKNAFYDTTTASNLYNDCKTTGWGYNGYSIDYIFTTREWRPQSWETVVNRSSRLTSSNPGVTAYANTYNLKSNPSPSDHNLIMSRLRLPAAP